jgi:hypothetical protein
LQARVGMLLAAAAADFIEAAFCGDSIRRRANNLRQPRGLEIFLLARWLIFNPLARERAFDKHRFAIDVRNTPALMVKRLNQCAVDDRRRDGFKYFGHVHIAFEKARIIRGTTS